MAARANPFSDATKIVQPSAVVPHDAMTKLAQLHAEATETARLADLLGRSLYIAIALPVFAALTITFAGGAGLPSTVAWAILILIASLSIGRSYTLALGRPVERVALRDFAQDLSACLLYAGFAWGAGAFLAVAGGADAGVALLFAGVPTLAVALLLRARQPALPFLAPVAALTSFACVLRPFAGGALAAALVLIACAVVAAGIVATSRYAAKQHAALAPAAA
jgi:hypothetical protein